MKKAIFIFCLICLLCGCQKKVENKEEYIPFYLDADTQTTYYVATPSGIIFEKASDSDLRPFVTAEGETININDYITGGK